MYVVPNCIDYARSAFMTRNVKIIHIISYVYVYHMDIICII